MKFLKENSYDIVKLYINQIGITIFALVLYTAGDMFGDDALKLKIKIILSVFSSLFYLALIYTATWDFGAKDRIKIDSSKLAHFEAKGFVMSLVANVPNLIFALVCVILAASLSDPGANGAFAFFNFLLRFGMAMFIGIIQGIFNSLPDGRTLWLCESLGYLVFPFLSVAVAQLGYSLGLRNFRFSALFSGKNTYDELKK